jgi:hypothetical protein
VGASLSSIAAIDHLRVRVLNPGTTTGTMTILFVDSSSVYQAKIVMVDTGTGGNGNNLETQIYGPASSTTPITVIETFFAQGGCGCAYPYYYLDALDQALQFTSVLQALNYPVTSTFSQTGGLTGDYAVVYDKDNGAGGITRVGGQGLVVPNYSTVVPAGTVSMSKSNAQMPSQTFTLEYGAVILDQSDGSVMAVPPPFAVSTTAAQTHVFWSLPSLVGQSNRVGGTDQAAVVLMPTGGGVTLEALAPRLTFAIPTSHPAIWAAFWNQQMVGAGLAGDLAAAGAACTASTTVQYSICTTASSATLNLYGPTTLPSSLSNDVFLTYRQSGVDINIQPAG